MTNRTGIGGNNPPSNAELLKEKHKPIFDKAANWLRKAKKADINPKTLDDCEKLEALFAEGRDITNDADRIRTAEKEPFLQAGREVDGLFNGEIRDKIGVDRKGGGLAATLLQAAADRRLAITREEQRKAYLEAERAEREAERLRQQAAAQEERGKVKDADVTEAKADGVQAHADTLAAKAAAPVEDASRTRTASGHSVSVGAKLICTGVVRRDLDLEELRPYFAQEDLIKAVQKALDLKAFTELKGAAIQEKAVGRVR